MIRIEIKGVNLNKFLKIVCQKYRLKNIERISHTKIEFDIESKNYKKFVVNCDKMCYTYKIKSYSGIDKYKKTICSHFGYLFGVLLVGIIFILLNNTILKIDIYGLQSVDKNTIYTLLKENDIFLGSKGKKEYKDLEKQIKESCESISQISIAQKGNYLILNIKEKLSQNHTAQSYDIVAEFDGIIENIIVTQGTQIKNNGDSFKKGDILVKGEFISMQGKVEKCKAIAKIICIESHTIYTQFKEYDFKNERTGESLTKNTLIFNDFQSRRKMHIPFENYEVEEKESYLFYNFFLPIKLKTTIWYEVKLELVKKDFEKEKDIITQNNEKILREQFIDKNIDKITTEYIKTGTGYLVVSTIQIKNVM